MKDLWIKTLGEIEKALPPQSFSTWIQPLVPVKQDGHRFVIQAPNPFFVDYLRDQKIVSLISDKLKSVTGSDFQIDFVVEKKKSVVGQVFSPKPEEDKKKSVGWEQRAKEVGLNPIYIFDNFVVGPSNQFAYAASTAVAGDSPRTYNPLFIYGGVGLGKTHLLNAIGSQKLADNPGAKVCFTNSEAFTNELIQSLANKRSSEFRAKYRSMDILLLDDIQFLAGKERTQEEFFHTFNTLYESGANIVVTSDKFPKEIPGLEDRLRSRFEWGLIADIQPPDMETKEAILFKKAELESIAVPMDVCHYLASLFTSNIRELEGSLTTIAAFASLTNTEISLDLAKRVLKDTAQAALTELTVDRITKEVATYYDVKVTDIKGKRRTKTVALARQVTMYLSRELTDLSLPAIGVKLGGRDHTTVLHGYRKIAQMEEKDSHITQQLNSIKKSLGR